MPAGGRPQLRCLETGPADRVQKARQHINAGAPAFASSPQAVSTATGWVRAGRGWLPGFAGKAGRKNSVSGTSRLSISPRGRASGPDTGLVLEGRPCRPARHRRFPVLFPEGGEGGEGEQLPRPARAPNPPDNTQSRPASGHVHVPGGMSRSKANWTPPGPAPPPPLSPSRTRLGLARAEELSPGCCRTQLVVFGQEECGKRRRGRHRPGTAAPGGGSHGRRVGSPWARLITR